MLLLQIIQQPIQHRRHDQGKDQGIAEQVQEGERQAAGKDGEEFAGIRAGQKQGETEGGDDVIKQGQQCAGDAVAQGIAPWRQGSRQSQLSAAGADQGETGQLGDQQGRGGQSVGIESRIHQLGQNADQRTESRPEDRPGDKHRGADQFDIGDRRQQESHHHGQGDEQGRDHESVVFLYRLQSG